MVPFFVQLPQRRFMRRIDQTGSAILPIFDSFNLQVSVLHGLTASFSSSGLSTSS